MTRPRALSGLLLVALTCVTAAHAATQPLKVTIIGDSVADRMQRNADALAFLTDGFRINLQTRGCRTLVITGCTIAGQTAPPPTTLQVAQRFGRYLGSIVVIEDGYNDDASRYRQDLDTVMTALRSYQNVKTVIWLTLRDPRNTYRSRNSVIRAAVKRWPDLVVADWNAYSANHPDWFNQDDGVGGIHPTPEGAVSLGLFIHGVLVSVAGPH